LRKVIGSLLVAGALTAVVVAPVAAETDLCITDPAVNVDGTVIQVGLYTHDPSLVAPGGIPQSGLIVVTILGSRNSDISTNQDDWTSQRPNVAVNVLNVLPGRADSTRKTVEIDALVPSPLRGDSYFIKVTMPNGAVKEASAPVNGLARIRVEVPVQD